MKCYKCGAEVSENDKFCEECGAELKQAENRTDAESKHENEIKGTVYSQPATKRDDDTKPKKKKTGLIICIAAIIVVLVVVSIFALTPSEYNFEAKELAAIISADTEAAYNKYEGKTVNVHGYLFTENGRVECILYSDKDCDIENLDLDEAILFSPTESVSDEFFDAGNGSEIIVTGNLRAIDDEKTMLFLAANSIEIVKAEEKTYVVDSVEELITDADKYMNSNVTIAGYVDRASSDVIFITDNGSAGESYALLKNVEEVYPDFLLNAPYGIYLATGKFYLDKGNAAIDLTELELVSEMDSVIEFGSVDDVIRSASAYEGEYVKVYGAIDGASEMYWLWNSDQTETIGLEGIYELNYEDLKNLPWVTVEGILRINQNRHPEIEVKSIY